MNIKIFCFLSFAFIYSSLLSFSQVVNIEKKRTDNPKGGLQGNIDFSFSAIDNGNSILIGKNIIKLQYFKGKHLFLFFNDLSMSQVNNNKFQNDGYQHLRYNLNLDSSRITPEAFVQHQYNTIKKLERRYVGGIGPRIKIIEKDTFRMYFGPLSMYEHEELSNDSITDKFRLSCYLSFNWNFSKWFSLNNITYYQPNYADFSDFRLASESNLMIRISNKLFLKSLFEVTYDSKPPPGVKNMLFNFTNGVSWVF